MNLLNNARQAMPYGGKLKLETANISADRLVVLEPTDLPPGDYEMLNLSDTAEGMSQQTKAYLFEPFYTTKEAGEGTDLGSATCYGIVR